MSNRTYNPSSVPAFNSAMSSATIRNEFVSVATGVGGLETEIDAKLSATPAAAGALIYNATAKTSAVDTDCLPLMDSEAGYVMKKLSWAHVKSLIGTYISTAPLALSNKSLTAPDIGTPFSGNLVNCTFPTLNQNTTGSADSAKDATGTGTIIKSTEAGVKIIYGRFTDAGVSSGAGFSLVKNGTGAYTLVFTAAFSEIPAVLITIQQCPLFLFVEVGAETTGFANVRIITSVGVPTDNSEWTISFMAIGKI